MSVRDGIMKSKRYLLFWDGRPAHHEVAAGHWTFIDAGFADMGTSGAFDPGIEALEELCAFGIWCDWLGDDGQRRLNDLEVCGGLGCGTNRRDTLRRLDVRRRALDDIGIAVAGEEGVDGLEGEEGVVNVGAIVG
jgi:hypothetical protein